jgi:alpha-methylacyl-CoA racemase
MVLADLGADVLRVDRPGGGNPRRPAEAEYLNRGRPCAALDLKQPPAVELLRELTLTADVFVEGFRPGVAERLGLGPERLCADNPRLVYARMTGWGQDGPLAQAVGHDINYAAIAGALGTIGPAGGKPVAPLNLVSDFGGGAMFLVAGILAALIERGTSGQGQVVDAAMVDGTAALMAMTYGFRAADAWREERGSNILDGGAPFYDTYECADGGYVAVGAIEPQFYSALLSGLGEVAAEEVGSLPPQMSSTHWPAMKQTFAEIFASRDRAFWIKTFEGTDACVSPVLTLSEAAEHEHLVARGTYVPGYGEAVQPAPAPRFSRSRTSWPLPAEAPGASTTEALASWGVDARRVAALVDEGVAVQL